MVFGDARWKNLIAVDTVLCVSGCLTLPSRLPSRGKRPRYSLDANFDSYWRAATRRGMARRSVSWTQFTRTPDFVLNLVDSLDKAEAAKLLGHPRQTKHRFAKADARQVIGTRCELSRPVAVSALFERFRKGNGFDFIPVGTPPGQRELALAKRCPGVFLAGLSGADTLGSQKVSRLSRREGLELLWQILSGATSLVVGPLQWTEARRFSLFEARQPVHVDVPRGSVV